MGPPTTEKEEQMSRFKLILITALGALAVPLVAASGAQADYYSCVFTGAAGPVEGYSSPAETGAVPPKTEPGVESILTDIAQGDEGDDIGHAIGVHDGLTDTDNGNGSASGTGEDGKYQFATGANGVTCAYVPVPYPRGTREPGIYSGTISSNGEYNNIVCGTGSAEDDGPPSTTPGSTGITEITTVSLPTQVAGPPGGTAAGIVDPAADGTSTRYRIDFVGGQGALQITRAQNEDGQVGVGAGVVSIRPTTFAKNPNNPPDPLPPEGCVNADVTGFAVAGAFAGTTT